MRHDCIRDCSDDQCARGPVSATAARSQPDRHRGATYCFLKPAIERSARGIEVRVVIADPRTVEASVEIRALDRRARGDESGFLHLIIAAAIMLESVDRLLRSGFFLGEERAGECGCDESDSAESSDHDQGFHLYVVNPSKGSFLTLSYIPATGIAKHDT